MIQDTPPVETELEELKNFFGKHSYGTANNRNEAAPVCFSIFQMAGLGEYIIGRKGKSTRFVWIENYPEIIKRAKQDNDLNAKEEGTSSEDAPQTNIEDSKTAEMEELNSAQINDASVVLHPQSSMIVPTSIEVKIDMTEWNLEKISAFFKIVNAESVEGEVETV